MRYKFKHQYVLSIKVYFPKCSPYLQVSSWASSRAQMVGGVWTGGGGSIRRATGFRRCSNRKGKASCRFLHLDSQLTVGTLRESFARIKCRFVHKKKKKKKEIRRLKEKSNYGDTELYRLIFSSYRKQPTNKVTKNRQLYAEQPKTSWFINIWRNFIIQTQPNCTFYNHILFVNS